MFSEYLKISKGSSQDLKSILDKEYQQLLDDRKTYRDIYIWAEDNNPGNYLIDNTTQMAINPFRIIEDVIYNYEDIADKLSPQQKLLDPLLTISKVKELCRVIPYAFFNATYEARNMKIPNHIETSVTLLRILIRTYLCTANLLKKKITNFHLDIIINKIKITFKNSLVEYGATVGIIAAQCISEPLTQYALDSRHRSGGGIGTQTNVVERIKEILGTKDTDKMKNTSMLIAVKPEYENSKLKVQEISNYIEMMDFERFIYSERIFFEEYGNPVHSQYVHEKKMIDDFKKYNIGIKPSSTLSKWCVRYELNKEELIINNMKLDTLIIKLRLNFPDLFIVYTPENSDNIILRCYIAQNMIKTPAVGFTETIIFDIVKKINKSVIRGVKDITYAKVIDIAKSKILEDGSISNAKVYAIITNGTNLEEVLENPYVDPYRTQTNSIKEFEAMYGIEATREKIIREIRLTMDSDDVIKAHVSIFAEEMVYSGAATSIQKTGLQIREASNVTLRLSFQSPIQVIENAATNSITDTISGVSSHLVLGSAPLIGTCYNNVGINEAFVESHYKNLSKSIEDEL
jgi:DNA-directed RNA polymerase beta' subunit